MNYEVRLRLKAGDAVRIDDLAFTTGAITEDGRLFTSVDDGAELAISHVAQVVMARHGRITTDALWRLLAEDFDNDHDDQEYA